MILSSIVNVLDTGIAISFWQAAKGSKSGWDKLLRWSGDIIIPLDVYNEIASVGRIRARSKSAILKVYRNVDK